jgi:hypothetical protein
MYSPELPPSLMENSETKPTGEALLSFPVLQYWKQTDWNQLQTKRFHVFKHYLICLQKKLITSRPIGAVVFWIVVLCGLSLYEFVHKVPRLSLYLGLGRCWVISTNAVLRVTETQNFTNKGSRMILTFVWNMLPTACGLEVRVLDYRCRGPGFDSRALPKKK